MAKKSSVIQNTSLANLIEQYQNDDLFEVLNQNFEKETIIKVASKDVTMNPLCKNYVVDEDEVKDLTNSILKNGILVPLLARKIEDKYEIISGCQRYFIAKKLNLKEIPLRVRPISDELMVYMVLKHNSNDSKVSILNKAYAYKAATKKFGISRNDIAIMTHQSVSQITNSIRLLKLSKHVLDELKKGHISFGHARVLVVLDEKTQEEVLTKIIDKRYSVRQLEDYISSINGTDEFIDLKKKLEQKFNSNVRFTKNKVSFSFKNKNDLEKFCDVLIKKSII